MSSRVLKWALFAFVALASAHVLLLVLMACAWFAAHYGLGAGLLLWGLIWTCVVGLVMGVRQ